MRKGGWFLVCAVAVSEPVQRVGFETQFSSQPEGGARRMQQNDRRDVCDGFHGRNNHQGTPVVERVETACWTLRDQLIPA